MCSGGFQGNFQQVLKVRSLCNTDSIVYEALAHLFRINGNIWCNSSLNGLAVLRISFPRWERTSANSDLDSGLRKQMLNAVWICKYSFISLSVFSFPSVGGDGDYRFFLGGRGDCISSGWVDSGTWEEDELQCHGAH